MAMSDSDDDAGWLDKRKTVRRVTVEDGDEIPAYCEILHTKELSGNTLRDSALVVWYLVTDKADRHSGTDHGFIRPMAEGDEHGNQ